MNSFNLTRDNFKSRIAQSFSRAAKGYDQEASLQKQVANQLLEFLPKQLSSNPSDTVILDLGTGTGYAIPYLTQLYPDAHLLGVDVAEGMLKVNASQNGHLLIDYICADAESLPFVDASVDLIVSSLAIQWCRDYPAFFAECKRVLKPQGQLYISTLGPRSLWQLHEAWLKVDEIQHVNRFEALETLVSYSDGLTLFLKETEVNKQAYPNLQQLLKSLKSIGASVVEHRETTGLGGRHRLAQLEKVYQSFVHGDGSLPLTYQVFYLAWCKNDR